LKLCSLSDLGEGEYLYPHKNIISLNRKLGGRDEKIYYCGVLLAILLASMVIPAQSVEAKKGSGSVQYFYYLRYQEALEKFDEL